MPRRLDDTPSIAIHLRLSLRAWDRYAGEAAVHRKPLSTYLRERLEREDELLAEIASIRRSVGILEAESPATSGRGAGSSANHLLEILLLCRAMAQPQRTEMVQAELRRLGIEVWRSPPPKR
jgi:hypothetical protein